MSDYGSMGYQYGFELGDRLRRCNEMNQHLLRTSYPKRNKKIMYVPQGFDAIDVGVIEALELMVENVIVMKAESMLEGALAHRPDIVLVMNGLHMFPSNFEQMLIQLKKNGIPTAIWFADDPYFIDLSVSLAKHFHYIFTHEINAVHTYTRQGYLNVNHLPLAVTSKLYAPKKAEASYSSDICFIGNAFENRIHFFNELIPRLYGRKIVLVGALWDRLQPVAYHNASIRLGWHSIEETVDIYNSAKIVLNIHRTAHHSEFLKNSKGLEAHSINPRTYEINACGAFQLTDIRQDLIQFYRPGIEIETIGSVEQCVEKINYYLENFEERNKIAVQGYYRTLSEHTFQNRLFCMFNRIWG